MRIALGSDEETAVVDSLVAHLVALGHEVRRVGIGAEWPEVGQLVARAVAGCGADRGVACCYTGTGVAIAANKVPGVRAALCTDAATAAGARRWNDANVLALGLRLLSPVVGAEILDAFLASDPDDDTADAVRRLESPGKQP
ncbi:MAG TPA: RpiB/LacA/LacB family sugar-phosphate isomerase [Acidimicrobiales bacterium]|nr:RpiB/LacA/LacB family sugar-phosphate isomerase [Acidimicrobiales bacterium]